MFLPLSPRLLGRTAKALNSFAFPQSFGHRPPRVWCFAFSFVAALAVTMVASGALVDVWRAEDLSNLNDGDTVGAWTSASNRVAGAVIGVPIFKRNVTPAGGSAVRFNRQRMSVANSPVGGRTAFSITYVFRADALGANDSGGNWYGKTGIIDAEQGGVTADWGTVLTETGQVGIGTGAPDISTYSTGASLVDSNYHVAVFTWGGGTQTIYVDNRAAVSQSGVGTAARNISNLSFGGINTDENGAVRRLVGDLVEIRFYDTALTSIEASNVIQSLRDTHVVGNLPRIFSFAASTNQIYLGQTATLSWSVSNALSVIIDSGIRSVAPTGSVQVTPTVTTTYSLTATNTNGLRSAQLTLAVDPGIPFAFDITTNTAQNTSLALTLRGRDPQGSNLTYSIVIPPAHGSLSGTPPNVTYTPANGYNGQDSFTFKVNDGAFDSAPATVSIDVVPAPTPPSGIVLSSTNVPSGAAPGAFIAAMRAIDVNIPKGDTHTFALVSGFGDNAQFVVSGSILSAGPTFAGGSGATFSIRLRTTDSTSFSYEQNFTLRVADVPRSVVINEIHYNGPDNTIRDEFIELYNATDSAIDISQWRIRGGIDFFFPANTFIPSHAFVIVAENPAALANEYDGAAAGAFGPWVGGLNNEGEDITLRDALDDVIDEVDFKSEFPWPIASNGDGPSMQLANPALDNNLGSSWRSGMPTPGAINSVFATNAAPNIRQVRHSPETPGSASQVTITCKVTDPEGVASVMLAYQIVAPGQYIPATVPLTTAQLNNLNVTPMTNSPNPAFEAATNWTSVAMHDDGLNGDEVANDGVYTVVLPPRANRTLVRYRITCTDSLGTARRAPFEDDPSLNFAYFVYDGTPAYLGFSPAVLQALPIYTLMTRGADLDLCTAWANSGDQLPQATGTGARNEGRLHFNWEGAVVYDGVVYDHVHYRLRGANGRYHPGKRSFRIRFNPGLLLDAKDQTGERFPTKWRELTTGKGQSNHGGEQFALNEVVNMFLFNKVGVPSPSTFHFHFRVIRGASETGTGPYDGDFWGINWAQEKYDVNFLDAHKLAKGNFYKLVDNFVLGNDERRYQAAQAVTNAQDFFNIENNVTGFQSTDWLLAHVNYTNWYRYYAICEAIRHYDVWPSANKNGAWYFEPLYGASNSFLGRMMTLPYDTTDTWGPTWNTGYDVAFNGIFNVINPPAPAGAPINTTGGDAGENPELEKECRNVVREVRDLLFQPDQINSVIDAFAGPLYGFVPADLARWQNAPAPASYASLLISGTPGVTGGLPGYVADMKRFMFTGGNFAWWTDRTGVAAGGWVTRLDAVAGAGGDSNSIPVRPTVAYIGTNGYPVDGLVFQSSNFADPQPADTFAAMRWRIAEVQEPGATVTNPAQLKLEWDAAWDSGELTTFNGFITIPDYVVQPEHVYRVRVRHKDNTGRWSQWSLPVEFRAGPRDTLGQIRTNLVFNEIMYNPPAEGATDGDEFEFLELKNIGPFTLNLSGLFFSDGITFAFTNGTTLAPGAVFLLARNPAMLATRYPGVAVRGVYTGKLNNDGEKLAISHPAAGEIISITYGDRAPWPVTADGFGFSLVRDAATGTYRSSAAPLGTPGVDGGGSTIGGVVINEVLSSSTSPLKDTIELWNASSGSVDISGWYLTDDPSLPQKFRIPARAPLAAEEFVVFTEDDFNPTPGLGVSFGLSSFGDDVYLFSADGTGRLTGYSHGFAFGAAQDGVSLGRYINSVGEELFPLQISQTFGAANSGPRVGPIVISELHYHPRDPADEFLELHNPNDFWTFLSSDYGGGIPTNTWRLSGLGYQFENTAIEPGGYMLLVADNPAAFRARWNVPPSVKIFQYAGTLQDSGENLELQAPDKPATNGVPYYAVDTVRYNDRKPWPLAADGAGASLQRIDSNAYANDPINWLSASPTPGRARGTGTAPVITSHPTSHTNATTTTASFSVTATGTAPLYYQWRFNGGNVDGATNPTLVLSPVQLSSAGTYQAVVYNAAGSIDSSNALLTVRVGPSVTSNPTNVALFVPPDTRFVATNRAAFSVGAVTYNPPMRYQWQFNGVDITGATNTTYSFTNVQLANEGLYTAVVTDSVGPAVSQPANFFGLITPQLTLSPNTQTAVQGELLTVNATATGNPLPFGWEWRRASVSLVSNTVNDRLNFYTFINTNSVPSTNQYRVVIRNLAGQANQIFNVITVADTDGDGIPDAWETQFGLNATNAADRNLDLDGDGLTNWQEYFAGTDPTSSNSFLKVSLSTIPGQATISFGAISNKTYTIQYRDDLNGGQWSKLGDILARPNSRVETLIDSVWTANRFYRAVTPRHP